MIKCEFSPFAIPLAGAQLIEASAGTGKTYTITSLFLRLVLERPDIDVRRILVVTFTEAATGELRDRVRTRIRGALDAFKAGSPPAGDGFLQELLGRHEHPAAIRLLTAALADFDEAAIFTIHGFCQRVLRDLAFEAGGLFDTQLISSQDDLLQRAVDDYWRKTISSHSRCFTAYCLEAGLSADSIYRLLGRYGGNPALVLVPHEQHIDYSVQESQFLQALDRIRPLWHASKEQVRLLLTGNKNLDGNKYRKASIGGWIERLDGWMGGATPQLPLFDHSSRFTNAGIGQAVKKGCQAPQHAFFDSFSLVHDAAQQLAALYRRQVQALQRGAFDLVRAELEKRKQQQNVHYFDDLLLRVYEGLRGPDGPRFAAAVRSRFTAALIDEFQDTDPVQYAIFSTVFSHPSAILFLIGDPKQAIYSFRNADIYTYLNAVSQVSRRHHLATNYRSDGLLIRGINTLFSRNPHPFLFSTIEFLEVAAARQEPTGSSGPPVELWYVPAAEHAGKSLPRIRRDIARVTAEEIARLVARGSRCSDIAVLVRTHAEAAIMQRELGKKRLPAIRQSTETIFDTPEAFELELVLQAAAAPGSEKKIAAACACLMLGGSAERLYQFRQDSDAQDTWLAAFSHYHELWRQQGFFSMLRSLILQQGVLERLVLLPQGERRVTNILHLAEVLHRQDMQAAPGMDGLVQWLMLQRNPAAQRLDEHQLRLESDEDAVRIVTIHKSKGLEYPIVFCPFCWGGASSGKGPVLFHDPADAERLKLDIGSADEQLHRQFACREALAEDLRLLYVSLTRAKHRCYLVWGAFKKAESCAAAYLLHGAAIGPEQDVFEQLKAKMAEPEDTLRGELAQLQAASGGAILIRELSLDEIPAAPAPAANGQEPALIQPHFTGAIGRGWRIASFSSLIHGRPHEQEFRLSDEFTAPVMNDPAALPERTRFTLPAGSQTGTMLHEILEQADFADPAGEAAQRLVAEKLFEYGLAKDWGSVLLEMLCAVAGAALPANGSSFTLQAVPARAQVHELGFYFPLRSCSKETLARFFSDARQPAFTGAIEELIFSPVSGFMNGFIDLVFCHQDRFYLLDWKSNFLGPAFTDYAPERLGRAMRDNFYFLQYHFYTLALHRYLQVRKPGYEYERHFGGVYYLFLRGIDPRLPGNGIFYDRPEFELLRSMEEKLIDRNLVN